MNAKVLVVCTTLLLAAGVAAAEVSVNVNIGIPAPGVVIGAPPRVVFETPPVFITPPRLGFYVGVDVPYDIFFATDYFYLYYGNAWYRSRNYNGPWVGVVYDRLPTVIRRHRLDDIRMQRDQEYRVYEVQRTRYHGRHFRPGKEWHEHWKDQRRDEREQWQDERRHDRGERRDDMRHERRRGHDD